MGDFGTGTAGNVLNIIGTLGGLFRGKIDKNVARALDGLRLAMAFALTQVASFMSETGQKQSKGVGILRRLWEDVILVALTKLDGWVRRAHDWLGKTLGPILRTLIKYRKKLLDFYKHWFRPIFDTIDAVRHVLRVLSFLHVAVAEKIDRRLAAFEDWVSDKLGFVLREINKLIDTTQLVIDEFGFYQRYTLVRSMLKYERDYWGALWLSAHKREKENPPPAATWPAETTPKDYADSVGEFMTSGGGPDSAALREYAQDVGLMLTRSVPLSL